MKKIVIGSTVVLPLLAAVALLSYHPTQTIKNTASIQPATTTTTTQTTAQPTTQTSPTTTTTSTSTTSITTTTQPMTVDQLKAEAASDIMAQPNAVQAYVGCFDEMIERRYQWNITETEMTHRLNSLETVYKNLCVAQHIVDSYPLSQTPPGFRD